MLTIIIKGIGLGMALAFLLGPVFFLLLQTSIKKGWLPAVFTALGVSVSDAVYVILTYAGLAQYSGNLYLIKIMGTLGGLLLIGFGLYSLFKKVQVVMTQDLALSRKDRLKYFLKGFTVNFINPAVLFFWIGAVSMTSLELKYNTQDVAIFFGSTVATVFVTDLVKIYLADKLSLWLNDRILLWLNRISGIALLLFGMKLLLEKVF